MSKTRVVYVVSLLALGVLLVLTVFKPMAAGDAYTQVQAVQLLEREDEWVVELNIANQEGQDMEYSIEAVGGGGSHSQDVTVGAGRVFKFIYHIRKDQVHEEEVSFAIYRKGEDTPLERVTYYLR